MDNMNAAMNAKMEKLAGDPNTTVLKTEFTKTFTPFSAARIQRAWSTIDEMTANELKDVKDEHRYRRALIKNDELLAFYKTHTKMFLMLTSREQMEEPRYRAAIEAMLNVRRQVETGALTEDKANVESSSAILEALMNDSRIVEA